jgi:hypothetical protein
MAANNDAAKGGADGLVLLLQRLAQESGHPELANTPLVFWGHSTAGPFGPSFAALHPERTVAFIRYHSGPTPGGDLKVIGHIPALFFCGGKDTGVDANGRSCTDSARALWASGRALGAPWTFAVEPDATHGDVKDLPKANDLLVPWITAVLRQRLSSDGSTLRAVTEGSAWLGNNRTGELALYGTFAGSKAEASWFPDEPSARAWQIVTGAAK